MSTKSQKRALPPTPTSTKYTNVSDAIQSLLDTSDDVLSDRERRWYNDLSNCQKAIEQKDSTIQNLKTIVMEWKKKAIEYENAYKETLQRLEDREQFLIKQHKAEIEAITKVQVDQTNENLDIILQLEHENHLLRQQQGLQQEQQQQQQLPNSYLPHTTSTTSHLCNNAEIANIAALENVSTGKQNSDELIQRINDMVNAMEGTLHDFKNNTTVYIEEDFEQLPPPLISDSSSSYSSSDEELATAATTEVLPKKKRSATIPNFLFRNKDSKKNKEEITPHIKRRNHSLNDHSWVQRKPVMRAASILSISS